MLKDLYDVVMSDQGVLQGKRPRCSFRISHRALGEKGTQNNVFADYIVAENCNPTSVTGEMWHLLVLWRWDVTAWTEQSVEMRWELLQGGSRCRREG